MSDSSALRATRQLRMSPGGRTRSSSRNLPELPPSSLTVTTAVNREIQGFPVGASTYDGCTTLGFSPFRTYDNPVPPPRETTFRSFWGRFMHLPPDGLNGLQPNQIHKFSFDMEGGKIGVIFRVDPIVFVELDCL